MDEITAVVKWIWYQINDNFRHYKQPTLRMMRRLHTKRYILDYDSAVRNDIQETHQEMR